MTSSIALRRGGAPVLRVFTVLDATLPAPIAVAAGQTRLWVVAPGKREARTMLTDLTIRWVESTFAGPVGAGIAVNSLRRCGLLDQPAVFAYPMPWTADTPVHRVLSPRRAAPFTTMGEAMAHLVSEVR